ncbi:deoxyribodipyrimidine photo-lyase [Kordia jejudonensis]|uniref:deoxyribodipyrimidine photo-lyase n=1 Tax=Kordia jejudonensis TaxID=1348245 RepID=UPI000AFE2DB3|nr:deoxyribodipyrimidine photo-lyase [Kordia jejudonensis]
MDTILLWFKNDLRLHDNEALQKAIETGKNIIPVYIFDTERYRNLDLGFPKTDQVGFDFIKQSVENLRENLKSISGNLLVRTGNAVEIIPKLAQSLQCNEIYAEQEFATEECQLLKNIRN